MAIVLIIQEQEITHKIPLSKKPYLLGRSSKCNLKLHDPMVSGKHCAFQISDEGKATVKDLDSSNGTYVNGFKIAETHIMMDDEVVLGAVKCWLDSSQLNPKERKQHIRETAKTRMKFINLDDEKENAKPRKSTLSRSREATEAVPVDEDFDPKTSIIKVDLDEIDGAQPDEDFTRTQIAKKDEKNALKKTANESKDEDIVEEKPDPSVEESPSETNNRLAKRVKRMEEKSKSHIVDPGQAVAGENEFENEETGKTKFLKVDTGKMKKIKASAQKKKAENKQDEEKDENLLGKIKGIFKK